MEGKPVKKKSPMPMDRIAAALLLACACGFSAGRAQAAPTDPAQIQTEAYVNLVQADQSLDAGRLDEALSQYQAARGYYLQLATDFPGWEPRVIQYRKAYCDNQIADIERRKGGEQMEEPPELEPLPEEARPEPAMPTPSPSEPATATASSVELDYLKSRIASLEAEIAEFDTIQDELDAVTAENDKLRKDLEAANRQLADRARGEQASTEGLRAELAAKEEQIQTLQKDLEAKKQLDQALNEMEAQANELRAQNERLNQEIKTLDGELDGAEVRADQAELKARQAEEKLAKAEQNLQKARKEQAGAEKQLASLPRETASGKTDRKEEKTKAAAKAPEVAKEEPKAEIAASPVAATVPPKPVPQGMLASDYVRQLLQEGDNDAALATVQEARKTFPTDMNLVLIEGIALIRLQRYPEAAAMLIDLAKSNPRNAEIHATLGAAMMGAGFYEEARETLLKAIKLDKNVGGEYYYNLAQLYALVDPIDLKQARRFYQQARDLGVAADKQLEKAMK